MSAHDEQASAPSAPAGGADDDTVPAEVTGAEPAAHGADEVDEAPGDLAHDGMTDDEARDLADEVDVAPAGDAAAQRDEYLDALKRVKAEFDNYKKRTEKERRSMVDRAAETIVGDLLPVLDACDAAVAHGDEGVAQIRALLLETLGKAGLEQMEHEGRAFDPMLHEAVLREEGDGGDETVAEVLRAGYTWRGRVVRPAMVKVRA